MKLLAPICLFAVLSLSAASQAPTPVVAAPSAPVAKTLRLHTPTDSDVYCAGYISDKDPVKGLFVITGEEGGIKQLYTDRDTLFLSRGAGFIINPGGEYMLIRRILDPTKVEMFYGQHDMMRSLGTVWAEVGRIKIRLVHEYVATAEVTHSCMELQAGDIAIPLNAKPTPPAPMIEAFDRFAPPSGKNEGVIVTGKEFQQAVGAGSVAYLNIGAPQGVEVGQRYRIFRTYATASNDPNRRYLDQTPHKVFGMRQSYKLTQEQRKVMPRDIVGEAVIISVNGKSSSALITMSGAEIFAGDAVELKP